MINGIVNVDDGDGEKTKNAIQFPAQAGAGRAKALTLEIAERICSLAARGISVGLACEAEEIDEAIFRACVIEDKAGVFRGIYARERVKFEEDLIGLIDKDARGAQFILERKLGWTKDADSQNAREGDAAQPVQCVVPADRIPELERIGRNLRALKEGGRHD